MPGKLYKNSKPVAGLYQHIRPRTNDLFLTDTFVGGDLTVKKDAIIQGTLGVTGAVTLTSDLNLSDGTNIISTGTTPTITTILGGGTCVIDPTSTDIAGRLTFTGTWNPGNTVTVNFTTDYATAPKVILGYNSSVNGGLTDSTTTTFTFTATGTAVGIIDYMVIESV